MMTEQQTLPVHFGDEAWELKITHEEIPGHVEEGQTLYGDTRPSVRKMRVRATTPYGEEVDPRYLLNSVVHEILHAAFAVAGLHPHNEEEVVGVLSGPLLQLLGDRRNSEVLQMFAPAPILQMGRSPHSWPVRFAAGATREQVENGEVKWRDPSPRTLEQEADALGKFARFSERDLTPYIEAVQRMAREAATVDPDTYARLVLSDEELEANARPASFGPVHPEVAQEAFIGTINSQGEKIEELENKVREQAAIITAQVETIAFQKRTIKVEQAGQRTVNDRLAVEERLRESSEEEASRLRGVVEKQHGWLRRIQEIVGPPEGGSALTKMRQIRKVLLEAFPKEAGAFCTAYSAQSGLYCEHPSDHLTDDSGFSHTFTRKGPGYDDEAHTFTPPF